MNARLRVALVAVLGLACVDTSPETWCQDHLEICGTALYSISPALGPTTGGTQVTLVGRALEEGGEIFFGDQELGAVSYDPSRQQATGVTPAGVSGPVMVRIVNRNGEFSFSGLYTFMQPTTVSSVSPGMGARTGGTRIEVRGANIHPGSKLQLGTVEATNIQINSLGTLISGDTPPAAQLGSANVRVSGPGGAAVLEEGFRYVAWERLPMNAVADTGGFLQLERSGSSSTFYAGTPSDLFRSDNNGESWTRMNRPSFNSGYQQSLAVDPLVPDRLYFSSDKVYWSGDGGRTWTVSLVGLSTNGLFASSLAVRASDGAVFALTYDSLYRSTDGGVNFSLVSTLPFNSAHGMCLHPTTPNLLMVLAYDGWRGVSTDGGQTFAISQEPGNHFYFCEAGLGANELWISDNTPSLRVSTDGITFGSPAPAPPPNYFYDLLADPSGAGRYFLSDGYAVLELNRADSTPAWNQIAPYEGGRLALDSNGRLLSAGSLGIHRRAASTGTSWTAQNTGLNNPNVLSLAQDSSGGATTLFMGTRTGKVFRTGNKGLTWEHLGTHPGEISTLAVAQDGSVRSLYALSGGTLFRYPLSGGGWSQPTDETSNPVWAWQLISDPAAPGELFTFSGDLFRRKLADGTFTPETTGLPDPSTHDYYGAVTRPTGGGGMTLYTVVLSDGLPMQPYAHPQGGTWAPVGTPLPESTYGDLRAIGATAEGLLAWLNQKLYLMPYSDGLWVEITGNTLPWYPNRFFVDPSDRAKVFTVDGNAIYRSDNSGRTWRQTSAESYGGYPSDALIDGNAPLSVYVANGPAGVLVSHSGGE